MNISAQSLEVPPRIAAGVAGGYTGLTFAGLSRLLRATLFPDNRLSWQDGRD